MIKKRIVESISNGQILVSDGAWGTFLQKKGLIAGDCPELWCIERPDDVYEIAKSYIDAGADMIETNSFGASGFKLGHYNLNARVSEINQAAARISRKAAGDNKWVLGSVGPTGKMLLMGDVTEEELYESFKEQVVALEQGGADAICIETMSAIDEASIAIRAAKENTNCEVICTFTFEKTLKGDYRTMMGISPLDATKIAVESGVDIVGTNCGNGFERMIEIVRIIRGSFPDHPILVHANAGLPKNIDGIDVFPDTPKQMADKVSDLINAGANIIGGCCGTTPEHIRAIKEAVARTVR